MKSIGLRNVKAFVDTGDIEIAPITIFVGRNSCGKSSFIRFPKVLAQTFASGFDMPIYLNGTQADSIDYGTFQEVLHNGSGEGFSVSLTYPVSLKKIEDYKFRHSSIARKYDADNEYNDEVQIIITYSMPLNDHPGLGKKVYATKIELYINHNFFSCFTKIKETKEYAFKQRKTIDNGRLIDVDFEFRIKSNMIQNFMPAFDVSDSFPAICKAYLGECEKEARELYTSFIIPSARKKLFNSLHIEDEMIDDATDREVNEAQKKVIDAFDAFQVSSSVFTHIYECMRYEFENLRYIGPFRSAPKRFYRVDEIEHGDVGVNGDYTSSLLINTDASFVKEVSKWLADAMDYGIKVSEVGNGTGLYQITVVDKKTNKESNLMDVGYGISQVLPIVTQMKKAQQKTTERSTHNRICAYPEIFIIEQPELHLHPAAQSELASLFANTVTGGKADKNRRLFIETHSEHLIRSLQYLIAIPDSPLTRDMVKFYYIDKTEENGSIIKEMKTNEYGQFLEPWPTGFFDEAHIMSKKLLEAIVNRKYSQK